MKGYRPHQIEAIERIMDEFDNGAEIVLLDAPTGSGKTLIAETVRRLMKRRSLYVCTTKTLQDQIAADFPYAVVLKGRSNYPTADKPELFTSRFDRLSASDCEKMRGVTSCVNCAAFTANDIEFMDGHDSYMDGDEGEPESHCLWCHPVSKCPYEQAKAEAYAADLSVINTAYLLAEANHVGRITKNRDLIIADECDLLESELMNHVEVRISARRREQLGIPSPGKKTVERAWVEWVYSTLPKIDVALSRVGRSIKIKDVRERQFLLRLKDRLKTLAPELLTGNWIYTGYESGAIVFRPIRVDAYGHDLLFRHSTKWLLMSATVIDPDEIVHSIGMQDKHWSLVRMQSTFPKENRPIRVTPVAEMTKKNREQAWPKMAEAITEILRRHPTERVLIHAVSYDLASYLFDNARDPRMGVYSSSIEREAALEHYRRTPGAVLVAPSMDRGVDLPYDQCDVVVIPKIPFPNLGDKQVSARLYSPGGQLWYAVQTIRTLVQMTGRGVRSADDTCISYILDKTFITNVWKKSRHLLPDWWSEALDWQAQPVTKKERVRA